MKEELQTALADVIISALNAAETAKEFVLAELPDVISQLLTWKLIESLVYFTFEVIGLALSIGAFVWVYRFVTRKSDTESSEARIKTLIDMGYSNRSMSQDRELKSLELGHNHEYAPLLLIPAAIGLICIATMFNTMDWLQILVAPKLYLLEYAAELVK